MEKVLVHSITFYFSSPQNWLFNFNWKIIDHLIDALYKTLDFADFLGQNIQFRNFDFYFSEDNFLACYFLPCGLLFGLDWATNFIVSLSN